MSKNFGTRATRRNAALLLGLVALAGIGVWNLAHPGGVDPRTEMATSWCAHDVDRNRERAAVSACAQWLLQILDLGPDRMQIGYLWLLDRLLADSPQPDVERFVRSFEPHFRRGDRGALVFEGLPRHWLPRDPGTGLVRFQNWVSAPYGRPESRAVRFIDDLTALDGEGYVLTHQILVLLFADEAGLDLPPDVVARRGRLLQKLLVEHRARALPGDLDFERSMILLLHDIPDPSEARPWIERILAVWDGSKRSWRFEASGEIRFEGRRYPFSYGDDHPTVVALGAVKTFLRHFAAADTAHSAGGTALSR